MGAAIAGAVGPAASVAAWSLYGAPRLLLYDGGVEVRNPLIRYVIPADAIDGATAGRWLTVRYRNGVGVRVWSVQAANISLMLDRRSHVDRVAVEVNEWIDAHRGGASIEVAWREPVLDWSTIAFLLAAGAIMAMIVWLLGG